MSSIISRLLIILISVCISQIGWAQTTRIQVQGKVPQGVLIQKNRIVLKKGFKVEKVSESKARVIGRMQGGRPGITGEFDCTCNGTSGGCSVIVTGSSVSCVKSTCSSSCYMIVTIPGAPTPALQR